MIIFTIHCTFVFLHPHTKKPPIPKKGYYKTTFHMNINKERLSNTTVILGGIPLDVTLVHSSHSGRYSMSIFLSLINNSNIWIQTRKNSKGFNRIIAFVVLYTNISYKCPERSSSENETPHVICHPDISLVLKLPACMIVQLELAK